jgi:DNA-binding response OmpR family regulator
MAHILIVDDDEMVAEMAADVLIDAGHACGWVVNGEQALMMLKGRRPDLLLLDQDMPGMSGAKVLRRLRGSPLLYDLPVIMFTALTGHADEQQALYHGAQDYIRKPFDAKFLTWRVNQVIKSRAERPKHMALEELLDFQSRQEDWDDTDKRMML